jgi:hypothetical protein
MKIGVNRLDLISDDDVLNKAFNDATCLSYSIGHQAKRETRPCESLICQPYEWKNLDPGDALCCS